LTKKLEEKFLVKTLGANGIRGERVYAPTLFGTLLRYALADEKEKLVEIISLKSAHFQEALKSKAIDDHWAFSIVIDLASDAIGGRRRTIDEIMEETFENNISSELLNIVHDQKQKEEIFRFAKADWIRALTIRYIDDEIEWTKKYRQELKKVKEELMAK